jgi:hypothetical protein
MEEKRVPPHSLEAEEAVLGAILLDTSALAKVMEILQESHFYSPANQKIFRAILDLFSRNVAPDLVTLTDSLKQSKVLEEIGGPEYLSGMVANIITTANVEHHARVVLDKALKRSVINASMELLRSGFDDTNPAAEICAAPFLRPASHSDVKIFHILPEHDEIDVFRPFIQDGRRDSFQQLDNAEIHVFIEGKADLHDDGIYQAGLNSWVSDGPYVQSLILPQLFKALLRNDLPRFEIVLGSMGEVNPIHLKPFQGRYGVDDLLSFSDNFRPHPIPGDHWDFILGHFPSFGPDPTFYPTLLDSNRQVNKKAFPVLILSPCVFETG